MTALVDRPAGCLPPVPISQVVAQPEAIRDIARANGPYFMPARYLIDGGNAKDARRNTGNAARELPSYLIGPVWRGDWAVDGQPVAAGTEALLHHKGFAEVAREMYGAQIIVPEQVYANLSAPMSGVPFSHVDIAEFMGLDRSNAPGWFLQAMGSSGLFEDCRITIATAVAWFHSGPRGYFRYWPRGRGADSVRHETMWNTAVVGDNDFMHHKVERVGAADDHRVEGLTIDTELDHDGDSWVVVDNGTVLARYNDDNVRLSVSWKAKVYADEETRERADSGDHSITVAEALSRFAGILDEPLAASGPDALESDALRDQLTSRWSGYVPG